MPGKRINAHRADDLERARDSVFRLIKEADGAGQEEDQHQAQDKAPIADAISYESLFRGIAGFLAIGVVTDEQVRAEPYTFPADKHQKKVVCEDQCQHREHEEIEIREEPVESRILVHVASGK